MSVAGRWLRVFARGARGFVKDSCLDLAAALTFWSVLGLFPAAIVVVALVGLVASNQAALAAITDIIGELAPEQAAAAIEARLREVVVRRGAAQVLLSFGLLGALWTSSAYLRAFTRAANTIYRVRESRPWYVRLPLQLGLTVAALVLVALVVVGLLVSGPVARAVGQTVGVGQASVQAWDVAKWPVLVLIAALLLSLLYWAAPDVRQRGVRWLAIGGAAALLAWIVASVGFGVYVANFGAYNVTYGALGTVIVFLVWMFLGNCAVLLGVEINAEVLRAHARP